MREGPDKRLLRKRYCFIGKLWNIQNLGNTNLKGVWKAFSWPLCHKSERAASTLSINIVFQNNNVMAVKGRTMTLCLPMCFAYSPHVLGSHWGLFWTLSCSKSWFAVSSDLAQFREHVLHPLLSARRQNASLGSLASSLQWSPAARAALLIILNCRAVENGLKGSRVASLVLRFTGAKESRTVLSVCGADESNMDQVLKRNQWVNTRSWQRSLLYLIFRLASVCHV